jgi:hypothetical protein
LPVDFRSRSEHPRAFRGASSALKRLRGLPCPVLPQESSAFRSNQHSGKINNELLHSLKKAPNDFDAFKVFFFNIST